MKFIIIFFVFSSNLLFSIVSGEGCKCKTLVSTQPIYDKLFSIKEPEKSIILKKIKEKKDLEDVYGISIDSEKNFYLIGIYQEKWKMIKFSKDGEVILKSSYDLTDFNVLDAMIIDGDCYIYFLGKIYDSYFLLKYDFDGKVLWKKEIEKIDPYKKDLKVPVDSPCAASLFFSEE